MLALGFGCDDGRGGDEDGGGIVLMDSGPDTTPDTGTPPPPRDSGVTPAGCEISSFSALPAGCLPRCANSTIGVINACPDPSTDQEGYQMCLEEALMNDAYPDGSVTFPDGSMQPIDCDFCWNWQVQSCIAETCPSEFMAWAMCDSMTMDCSAQTTAINECIMMNGSAINSCANPRVSACFDMGSGFLPSFEGPQFQLSVQRTHELIRMVPGF
ncbi:MAG: hypothetical protein VYE22_10905 [Myxococcota bacterium]|nr:hypothetical protein [Myxococcota bacterium]